MDQVYLPKNRHGFSVGTYVVLAPIQKPSQAETERPYFYYVQDLEPLKVQVIQEIFILIEKYSNSYENIIITGSFLEKGFCFNDIDILLISEQEEETTQIKKNIEEHLGIKAQVLVLTNKEILKGLGTDPLYEMMLSKCVAKKRFIYKTEKKIDYKLLDLHLLKSKTLIENFDMLDGSEKWYLIRNLFCISLFLEDKKINNEEIKKKIEKELGTNAESIKKNMLEKNVFLKKYKAAYHKTFMLIVNAIKHDAKQK